MNKKQLASIAFLIWSAINTGILLFASDEAIRYVSGELGEYIIAGTIVVDILFLFLALINGIIDIYLNWFGD